MQTPLCLEKLQEVVNKANFFTSDSRLVDKNTIFVALKGENLDGHDFVHDALNKGALACIVEKELGLHDPRIIRCENSKDSHRLVAKLFRQKFKGKIIAIAGSNGKTSTKDFLYTLVSHHFSAIKTLYSQNGYLGIPATLERLRPGLDLAIIEVGIDGPGDMKKHLEIVDPDICVLTSIGAEHLRLLGDLEGVFQEESQIVEYCSNKGAPSFVPSGDPFIDRLKSKPHVQQCPRDPQLINSKFECPQLHGVARVNASLAISVALKLGMSIEEIIERLPLLKIPAGRGEVHRISDLEFIQEDFYNANQSSMKTSIELASKFSDEKKLPLYLVLGDMLDLGETSQQAHSEILSFASKLNYASLILIGDEFSNAQNIQKLARVQNFKTSSELTAKIPMLIKKPYFVLFKGSRGMRLEKAMNALKGAQTPAGFLSE